jgi:hypothetical protein
LLGRPLGTHWLPERPFPFPKSPAKDRFNAKRLSGRFRVIRAIVVPMKAQRHKDA